MTERRELPYRFRDVRARLQARLPELLKALGIQEEIAGKPRIFPLNPTRDDRKPGSFVIWNDLDRVGAWKDFACGDEGSILDLIIYLKKLAGPMDAYWWALDFLGLARGEVRGQSQVEQDRRRDERDRLAREAKAEKDAAETSAKLFERWMGLGPFTGTVAETYLREARAIPLDRLRHQPGAIRFAPAVDHFDDDTGEVTTWPAMVTAMTRGQRVAALHTTWLAPDGSGKAPVTPAKKMRGPVRGAAIRLGNGPSGLSPGKAEARGRLDPLAIGEGIETSLTVACACPDYRVWAAGSLDLMGLLDWPACASSVVLLRDNDWKPTAQLAFDRVLARWRAMAAGRPVHVVQSEVGSDFNDWARAS